MEMHAGSIDGDISLINASNPMRDIVKAMIEGNQQEATKASAMLKARNTLGSGNLIHVAEAHLQGVGKAQGSQEIGV